jgi:glycosyltransferase involved in cell wall biosynthesis
MNKEMPLVGICIPAYEDAELIDRAIKSISTQTYKKYIVIVSDDSKTNTIEYYLQKRDIPIVYSRNKVQLGASGNTNKAISIALEYKVDLIKILYQDDWFTYECSLEKMVDELIASKSDIVFCGNIEVYKTHEVEHICSKKTICEIKKDNSYIFRANDLGAPSNILYKAQDVFFDSTYQWLLDVDFYLRILPNRKLEYIYEPLISIGHDGDQLTDYYNLHPLKKIKEILRQYRKYKWIHKKLNRRYLVHNVLVNIKIYLIIKFRKE